MTGNGSSTLREQILVSGVGGQGVLFITRLLADAAIRKGAKVLTSETHGMAQRGGVVVSHLKVGDFASPLIRAGRADGLILLKEENLPAHRPFLRTGGWAVTNSKAAPGGEFPFPVHAVDADGLAAQAGIPHGANLVLLGFVLAMLSPTGERSAIFCTAEEMRETIVRKFGEKPSLLAVSLEALELGMFRGRR